MERGIKVGKVMWKLALLLPILLCSATAEAADLDLRCEGKYEAPGINVAAKFAMSITVGTREVSIIAQGVPQIATGEIPGLAVFKLSNIDATSITFGTPELTPNGKLPLVGGILGRTDGKLIVSDFRNGGWAVLTGDCTALKPLF